MKIVLYDNNSNKNVMAEVNHIVDRSPSLFVGFVPEALKNINLQRKGFCCTIKFVTKIENNFLIAGLQKLILCLRSKY